MVEITPKMAREIGPPAELVTPSRDAERRGIFTSWRIVDISVEPLPMIVEEPAVIEGKVQTKMNLPWAEWHPPKASIIVALILDGREVTQKSTTSPNYGDFFFRYEPQVAGSKLMKLEARNEIGDVFTSRTMSVYIKEPSEPPDGEPPNGEPPNGRPQPPSFWNALSNLDFNSLWKYHRGKTMALGIGGGAVVYTVTRGE